MGAQTTRPRDRSSVRVALNIFRMERLRARSPGMEAFCYFGGYRSTRCPWLVHGQVRSRARHQRAKGIIPLHSSILSLSFSPSFLGKPVPLIGTLGISVCALCGHVVGSSRVGLKASRQCSIEGVTRKQTLASIPSDGSCHCRACIYYCHVRCLCRW